jgi:hypothetical protein
MLVPALASSESDSLSCSSGVSDSVMPLNSHQAPPALLVKHSSKAPLNTHMRLGVITCLVDSWCAMVACN